MLEQVIRLYTAYMMQDVRSPIPHLAGPPGVGKSTVVQQLADLLGVRLHIINVARLSPLELEGVQMPVGNVANIDDYRLHLLTSTIWTQLKEGDIVLLDEFMRGFPEVYNGLLDIMTSRQVAGYQLPKVFFIAASNSVAAYDKALEDRLLHLFVDDIRSNRRARAQVEQLLINEIGLHPAVAQSYELESLITQQIEPMYQVLDQFANKAMVGSTVLQGQSVRKLIGQAKLREIQCSELRELISLSNTKAAQDAKWQFVIVLPGVKVHPSYWAAARQLVGNPKLTKIQSDNLALNLQLIEMQQAAREPLNKEGDTTDDADHV